MYGWFGERVAQKLFWVLAVFGRFRPWDWSRMSIISMRACGPGGAGTDSPATGKGRSLDEAKAWARKHCVFTTHTPIKAGNEAHPHQLLQYLGLILAND